MLRARIASVLRPLRAKSPDFEEREAYQSDIRELRPEVWSRQCPRAFGSDVEQAMLLAGVCSRDFARVVGIDIAPHLVTPVDDIVSICRLQARACGERAKRLCAELPPPNPWGRPPLPLHRRYARDAEQLHRSAMAWGALASALVNNYWDHD